MISESNNLKKVLCTFVQPDRQALVPNRVPTNPVNYKACSWKAMPYSFCIMVRNISMVTLYQEGSDSYFHCCVTEEQHLFLLNITRIMFFSSLISKDRKNATLKVWETSQLCCTSWISRAYMKLLPTTMSGECLVLPMLNNSLKALQLMHHFSAAMHHADINRSICPIEGVSNVNFDLNH